MSLIKVAPAPETKAEDEEAPVDDAEPEDDEPDDEDTLFVDLMIERLIKVRHAKARTEVSNCPFLLYLPIIPFITCVLLFFLRSSYSKMTS